MSLISFFLLITVVFSVKQKEVSSILPFSVGDAPSETCTKTVSAVNNDTYTNNVILYLFPQSDEQAVLDNDCASGSKQIFNDNDFQLHEPNTPSHVKQHTLIYSTHNTHFTQTTHVKLP